MDFDRLIRNWHIKASEEDYFSKFTFEYLAFIAFLRKKKFKYDTITDRKIIQKLKRDNKIKAAYLSRIRNNWELKSVWEEIKKEFDIKPFHDAARLSQKRNEHAWWNCSYFENPEQTKEGKEKRKGVIHSLEDWGNMVEFWYCVRNNLFHGEKDPEHERDEFAVEFGYKTLRELVEILLVG
jgi:hypothetical protein